MQTNFSLKQLQNPRIQIADDILRKCVHCGFCTATCPTYVLGGNELDSPRGRIYQIKDMFEQNQSASPQITKHLDRCLSCLSCMTTCPSGVHYMHLVDEARAHMHETGNRPFVDKMLRSMLANILPYPNRFRLSLQAAKMARVFKGVFALFGPLKPLKAMLALAPANLPDKKTIVKEGTYPATGKTSGRVALLTGCANAVLQPSINAATIRVLNRQGIEVVVPSGMGCCGSLEHHLGREDAALAKVRKNVAAWSNQINGEGLDAIIVNASGCGTTVKDYGHMLRHDADFAQKAAVVSSLARDISEYLQSLPDLTFTNKQDAHIAYHSACSLQHGQKITTTPQSLLGKAGFKVSEVPEGHLCCGSAGVYNIFQSEIAAQLKYRKIENIAKISPDIIAAGNIGCITQLENETDAPIVHTIELLDWAQGGPKPAKLENGF